MDDRKIFKAKANPSPMIRMKQFRMTKEDRESPEGRSYKSMLNRGRSNYNKKHKGYRDISVCDRWLDGSDGFQNFVADMGTVPTKTERWTIDRLNNKKGYSPDNCRWATYKDNSNNKTNNRYFEYKGRTQTMTQWAEEYNIKVATLHWRLKNGWSFEEAILSPVGYVK